METQLLQSLNEKYSGKIVDNRAFFKAEEFAVTAFISDETIKISIELPSIASDTIIISELTDAINAQCEYIVPSFVICIPSDSVNASADSISTFIDKAASILKSHSIDPALCVCCQQPTDQYYNLNSHYCPLHRECANSLLQQNSAFKAMPRAARAKGFIVGTAFAFFGSAFYILFACFGVMPALGGIFMGLFAALGFRMFNNGMKKSEKIIFAAIFVVLAALGNFAADYVYANANGLTLDFTATYTEALNLFNTIFDVVAGVIIAVCAMSVVLDINRSVGGYRIKKL